jgi:DtxR family transcriptional regulator, Mn-dependent transcriptional regulator
MYLIVQKRPISQIVFIHDKVNNPTTTLTNIDASLDTLVTKKRDNHAYREEEEELYLGTAEEEHIEMYLKAIWFISEKGENIKVSSIAKLLNVRQPSVVQMLHKLNHAGLVAYNKGNLVKMTTKGNRIGRQMIRNTRLLEVMMKDALKIEIDEEMACGIEHHMKEIFTDALCILLKHPRRCPHGHSIPTGKCCKQ